MSEKRQAYPSDITRQQFEKIKPILLSGRKTTKHMAIDLYDIFCGLTYVLKTGCQWRHLPHDLPHWSAVYYHFQRWSEPTKDHSESRLNQSLKQVVQTHREQDNRKPKTSFIIVDSQSVKNTDTAREKGYDGNKKVSGIKRHIAVDTQGLPHIIHITTANISDRAGAIEAFSANIDHLSRVKNVLGDSGYTGENFANGVETMLSAGVEIAKKSELHTFKVIPKRWVVERSFSWLEKCRRLWKNCERKLKTSLEMTIIAFLILVLKRIE